MNKLLVICPTRQRPELCQRMYLTAKATSSQADFFFCVDEDDPTIQQYLDFFKEKQIDYSIGTRGPTTLLFNIAFAAKRDYEFYCLSNDDFVFRTPAWDTYLCRKGKICYGNDLLGGEALPTCPVIDGDIVRALGWLQLPTLSYMYGDTSWKMIGIKLNALKYFPQVIIEHMHWMNKKADIDDIYKTTNSARIYESDEKAYRKWHREDLEEDIRKIKEMLSLREEAIIK
jgi:hypothetical protein